MWRVKERKEEKTRNGRTEGSISSPHHTKKNERSRTPPCAHLSSSPTPPLLLPSQSAGQAFRCKGVQRSYAFGDATVPRAPTQYLKVVLLDDTL